MGPSTEKYKRRENGSNRQRQKSDLLLSSSCDKEEHQRQLNETNEQDEAPSSTMLYDLPLEMLDIILKKSYLHRIFHLSTKERDEDVIRSLISVDVCFNRRITRKRFKNAIWRYLKEFYRKTQKRSSIIRNNRNYLLENIQPNDEFIDSLFNLNCITEEQRHFIQRQRSNRDKNAQLLYIMRSIDETKFSNFVKCLRQTDQKTVGRIIENGGGVIKIEVQTRGAKCTTSMETQLFHQKIKDLRNRTTPWSHQSDKLISQLRYEGIEILNSHLDRQTVVVWIWCRSQAALEHTHRLYSFNELIYVFFENIQPSTSKVINIDRNQFQKTVVVSQIFINFTQIIVLGRRDVVFGMTKLRNEIYVLCQSSTDSSNVICVFENRNSFHLHKEIEINYIKSPWDIGSSEKEQCLYISDYKENCVWKITRETDDQHTIIKWLIIDYQPCTLSVSRDDQLLLVSESSSVLLIYGSDAELTRSIPLPKDITCPRHAVETSIGSFIILHRWMENEESESSRREWGTKSTWSISEVTRDGQMIIRHFIPSNERQEVNFSTYISLDSEDRVFVADRANGRVILLDSDLKWNQILCPTKEEGETNFRWLRRLCYDEETKQLIVGRYLGGVNIYALSRN